ncbi:MAG: hypothetical protein JRG91_15515 [Deltaproteobacteria bacterium]|nr:hypothetical protein [Deltaproteobacteria bacterium]
MNRNTMLCCLLTAGLALYAADGFSQEGGGDYEPLPPHPTGFMIEGLLSQSIYTVDPSSFTILNAIAVPNAILGYKMRALAIGLGIAFYRASYSTDAMGADLKNKTAYTSVMLIPRFEITVYRSKSGIAEAYIPLGFGVGFHLAKDRTEGMVDDERTDSDVVLGAHAGLGARVFLGGSPFALGTEFGWSGSWAHMKDWDDDDQDNWSGVHGIYGSIIGTFVFD